MVYKIKVPKISGLFYEINLIVLNKTRIIKIMINFKLTIQFFK
jgi:hypothetical protein